MLAFLLSASKLYSYKLAEIKVIELINFVLSPLYGASVSTRTLRKLMGSIIRSSLVHGVYAEIILCTDFLIRLRLLHVSGRRRCREKWVEMLPFGQYRNVDIIFMPSNIDDIISTYFDTIQFNNNIIYFQIVK